MGIDLFYRDRFPQQTASIAEEITLPKHSKTAARETSRCNGAAHPKLTCSLVRQMFLYSESTSKIADDSLPKILADIGDCTRCKLHRGRNKLVFATESQRPARFRGRRPGPRRGRRKVFPSSAARENC